MSSDIGIIAGMDFHTWSTTARLKTTHLPRPNSVIWEKEFRENMEGTIEKCIQF
jgi:hypothetical protein